MSIQQKANSGISIEYEIIAHVNITQKMLCPNNRCSVCALDYLLHLLVIFGSATMATIVSDSSSDENRPVSPDKTSGRQRKLDFVWMETRLEHTPRGSQWISREGRVKEISFNVNHNSQQMKELICKNFTKLAQADFSR